MANLWRALALAWLGGIASPLLDEMPAIDTVQTSEFDTADRPTVVAIDPDEAGGGKAMHPRDVEAEG